jgi:hypothetical protein
VLDLGRNILFAKTSCFSVDIKNLQFHHIKKRLLPALYNELLVAITRHPVSYNIEAWIADIMSLAKLNIRLRLNLGNMHRLVDTTVCAHLIVHPDPPDKFMKILSNPSVRILSSPLYDKSGDTSEG